MTTKDELYTIIAGFNEMQLEAGKKALTNILAGKIEPEIPVCDLGSSQDVVTLYEAVTDDKKNKM